MTLDDFIATHRIGHIDVMKLDVEGAEEEIITASRSIENIDVIVGELHLKMVQKERILAFLEPVFRSKCEPRGAGFEVIVARNRKLTERAA